LAARAGGRDGRRKTRQPGADDMDFAHAGRCLPEDRSCSQLAARRFAGQHFAKPPISPEASGHPPSGAAATRGGDALGGRGLKLLVE
jgi:hypothetical protein